jgi:hypothetical protein
MCIVFTAFHQYTHSHTHTQVHPRVGSIGPYDVQEVTVYSLNDMCGDFGDVMRVKMGALAVKRVPVKIGVVGSVCVCVCVLAVCE